MAWGAENKGHRSTLERSLVSSNCQLRLSDGSVGNGSDISNSVGGLGFRESQRMKLQPMLQKIVGRTFEIVLDANEA